VTKLPPCLDHHRLQEPQLPLMLSPLLTAAVVISHLSPTYVLIVDSRLTGYTATRAHCDPGCAATEHSATRALRHRAPRQRALPVTIRPSATGFRTIGPSATRANRVSLEQNTLTRC